MAQYKTPDVYVRERSTLPPSVAEVATAIPVFVGYTEKTTDSKEESIVQKPIKITTMADYHAIFGGKYAESFGVFVPENQEAFVVTSPGTNAEISTLKTAADAAKVSIDGAKALTKTASDLVATTAQAVLDATDDASKDLAVTAAESAVTALNTAENTEKLLVINSMPDITNYFKKSAVKDGNKKLPNFILAQSVEHFFANGGGACYIVSTGDYSTTVAAADFNTALGAISAVDEITLLCLVDAHALDAMAYYDLQSKALQQCSELQDRFTLIDTIEDSDADLLSTQISDDASDLRNAVTGDLKYGAAYYPNLLTSYARHYDEDNINVFIESLSKTMTLSALKNNTFTYNLVKKLLTKNYLTLPPSPAVAGMIAKVDGTRGVWKAPANVALSMVQMPSKTIKSSDQDSLNVDTTSGKSINAIRSFTGKGNLVWGARTLAGNDNEWRYISVRRLFNMVEESIQKATAFAVFEPNTSFTWLKLKTMMESYLTNLWKQGALFGDTPEQAFIVNVGLGQTMTEDDINNGIMNIEIGLAAVRPAEFIVLTFSHKSIEG
jgi:phage tail sheath protein FI